MLSLCCRRLVVGISILRSGEPPTPIAAPDVYDGTSAVGESRHRIPRRIRCQPTELCLQNCAATDCPPGPMSALGGCGRAAPATLGCDTLKPQGSRKHHREGEWDDATCSPVHSVLPPRRRHFPALHNRSAAGGWLNFLAECRARVITP